MKRIKVNDEIKFENEVNDRVNSYKNNSILQKQVHDISNTFTKEKYTYNFSWLGRPIFQGPSDLQVYQEIIWDYKPDLIIETGIARGGSLIFFASMMALLEYCGEIDEGEVLGIDIDIREHNKDAILKHPLSKKITMIEGSSIDKEVIKKVKEYAINKKRIFLILDSNHTHDHVLEELRAYAPLIKIDGFCIVCDTGIEYIKNEDMLDRPWAKGNSPKSALTEYLKENTNFEIDSFYENKSLITCAPDGFLKRVR